MDQQPTDKPPTDTPAVDKLRICGKFPNLQDAQAMAMERFLCVVVAYCCAPDGSRYIRPMISRDPAIIEYWVIELDVDA